ncbi:MAG: thioredoxin [Lachnospiraceae bacterium]|nr:thioredoxin [Lachnospiraceae bacterium]
MAILSITKNNFEKEVKESKETILLDFWASWCGPCQMVGPILEEIASERPDIKIGKINVEEEPELADEFQIMSIPTLMVVKEGQVVKKSVGAKNKNQILEMM